MILIDEELEQKLEIRWQQYTRNAHKLYFII